MVHTSGHDLSRSILYVLDIQYVIYHYMYIINWAIKQQTYDRGSTTLYLGLRQLSQQACV